MSREGSNRVAGGTVTRRKPHAFGTIQVRQTVGLTDPEDSRCRLKAAPEPLLFQPRRFSLHPSERTEEK